jgi:pSer/pThr/pTyr-binding forkhead associated (FHA) protein
MATVLVHAGGRVLLRDEIITLGRGRDCHVVIDDPSVSRRHARLAWRSDAGTIFDLDSPNGVFVNDKRIVRSAEVHRGDALRLGKSALTLELDNKLVLDIDEGESEDDEEEDDEVDQVTVVANSVALSVAIASRLLASGNVVDAERSLRHNWDALATRAHAVHPALTVLGARTGLHMAAATRVATWANDAAMMLASVDQSPDQETLADIEKAVAAVGMTPTMRTYLVQYRDDAVLSPSDTLAIDALLARS